jgi:hypothetical protein
MRRAKRDAPQLVIDPDAVALDPRKIVVKHTDDGGYLCLGFGASAEFLCALDIEVEDEASVALTRRDAPLLTSRDPFLRRLGTAVALAKKYDPNEPRDARGRWTSEGAATASVADSVIAPEKHAPALRQFAANTLAGAAAVVTDAGAAIATDGAAGAGVGVEIGVGAAAAGAALALGVLVISTTGTGGGVATGSVPNASDLGYSLDQDTGVLTLTRTNADGTKDVVYEGHPGPDGLFRDQAGNVVGRRLDGSIVIDPDAVPGYESRAKTKDRSAAAADVQVGAIAKTDDPKLCPDPGPDTPGWMKRSERSLAYQEQISGLPRGLAVELNGVSYDGCREDGVIATMLDAKAQGYLWALKGDGTVRDFYTGFKKMIAQADRQVEASGGRLIEWYFAEKPVADFMAAALATFYPTIKVIWQPPLKGKTR